MTAASRMSRPAVAARDPTRMNIWLRKTWAFLISPPCSTEYVAHCRLVHAIGATQAQERGTEPEAGHQPSGQRHPLQDPHHEEGEDDGEAEPSPEDPALEDVVASGARERGGQPRVGKGDGKLEHEGEHDPEDE